MMRRTSIWTSVVAAAMLASAGPAWAAPPIVNGNFENNGGQRSDAVGWTTVNFGDPNGQFFAETGNTSPYESIFMPVPPEGSFAEVNDETAPGTQIVYQDFVVPAGQWKLTMQVYVNATAGAFIDPNTLDYTVAPNQIARIDLVDPLAPITTVGAGLLLPKIFFTNPGDPTEQGYMLVSADLSAFAGQTVRLRFASVGAPFPVVLGVDDVKVVPLVSVPGTSRASLLALGIGVALMAAFTLGRRRTSPRLA